MPLRPQQHRQRRVSCMLLTVGVLAVLAWWLYQQFGPDGTDPALAKARTQHAIDGLVLSPDGKLLVSSSASNAIVQAWRLEERRLQLVWESQVPKGQRGMGLAFSPDGQLLAVGGAQHIELLQAWDGHRVRTIGQHPHIVAGLAFSPDGRLLASIGYEAPDVRVWGVRDGRLIQTLRGTASRGYRVAFSPDGQLLATTNKHASRDGYDNESVLVWQTRDWQLLHRLSGHRNNISGLVFTPDSRSLISGSWDGGIRIWDVANGHLERTIDTGHCIYSMAMSPDSRRFATGCGSPGLAYQNVEPQLTLRFWDAATGQQLRNLQAHTDWINGLVFSSDGRQLFSGSWDTTIKMWPVP